MTTAKVLSSLWGYYEKLGYDIKMIEQKSAPDDVEDHPVIGETYSVAIHHVDDNASKATAMASTIEGAFKKQKARLQKDGKFIARDADTDSDDLLSLSDSSASDEDPEKIAAKRAAKAKKAVYIAKSKATTKVKKAAARAAKKEKKEVARDKKAARKAKVAEKEAQFQKKEHEKAEANDKANQAEEALKVGAILKQILELLSQVDAIKARACFPQLGQELQAQIENGLAFAMELKQRMQAIQLQLERHRLQDGMGTPRQVMNKGNMLKLKHDLAKADASLKILEQEGWRGMSSFPHRAPVRTNYLLCTLTLRPCKNNML